mmetsp:Transcript_13050/g.20273  ORF Transcript_13050/g.20273 Transcript_13050/m.20273 type:complete len:83 (-) Transcript_13050:169-417(-)
MLSIKNTTLFFILHLMLHVGTATASQHQQNCNRLNHHRRWSGTIATKKRCIPDRRTRIDIAEIVKLSSHSRFVDRLGQVTRH